MYDRGLEVDDGYFTRTMLAFVCLSETGWRGLPRHVFRARY